MAGVITSPIWPPKPIFMTIPQGVSSRRIGEMCGIFFLGGVHQLTPRQDRWSDTSTSRLDGCLSAQGWNFLWFQRQNSTINPYFGAKTSKICPQKRLRIFCFSLTSFNMGPLKRWDPLKVTGHYFKWHLSIGIGPWRIQIWGQNSHRKWNKAGIHFRFWKSHAK